MLVTLLVRQRQPCDILVTVVIGDTVRRSVTAAAGGDHVVVLFQDDVLVVVEVQQTDGVEFVGHTRRRAQVLADAQGVHDALNRRMVRRLLVLPERERTAALAVIGVVALRRDDPARPADLVEVDVQLVSRAGLLAPTRVLEDVGGATVAPSVGRRRQLLRECVVHARVHVVPATLASGSFPLVQELDVVATAHREFLTGASRHI